MSEVPSELSIVIPVLNEVSNLRPLISRIDDVCNAEGIKSELIFVDDSSTDGSGDLLFSLANKRTNLQVVFRDGPKSLSMSWHAGFSLATKNVIVCIDADLCHDPADFIPMLSALEEADLVIGSRYLEGRSMEDKSWFARNASFYGRYVTKWITGLDWNDTSHSFRMFKKSVFQSIAPDLDTRGNAYLIHFLMLVSDAGFRITEIPITYGQRIYGETKLNVFTEVLRYIVFLFRLIGQRYRTRRNSER